MSVKVWGPFLNQIVCFLIIQLWKLFLSICVRTLYQTCLLKRFLPVCGLGFHFLDSEGHKSACPSLPNPGSCLSIAVIPLQSEVVVLERQWSVTQGDKHLTLFTVKSSHMLLTLLTSPYIKCILCYQTFYCLILCQRVID